MFLKIEQMDMQLVGGKKRANRVSDIQTALPQEVPEKIHQLLEKYHNAEKITLYDIAKFHAQFENIHPFQDGNGRVGRMIILKQCLDHNIVPVNHPVIFIKQNIIDILIKHSTNKTIKD